MPTSRGPGSPRAVTGTPVAFPGGRPSRLGGNTSPPWLSSFSRNSRHSRAFSDPVRRFHPSNSHTVAASSIRLRPPHVPTISRIRACSALPTS